MTTRETMLDIARHAIDARAVRDGYAPGEYDCTADDDGYVTSLLTALRHWSHAHGIDWNAELSRADELFQEDIRGGD